VNGELKLTFTARRQRERDERPGASRRIKMNPPFATGPSLGRDAKVSRFAAGLCVTISTRRAKLFEVH
jgi:hypothetical protein